MWADGGWEGKRACACPWCQVCQVCQPLCPGLIFTRVRRHVGANVWFGSRSIRLLGTTSSRSSVRASRVSRTRCVSPVVFVVVAGLKSLLHIFVRGRRRCCCCFLQLLLPSVAAAIVSFSVFPLPWPFLVLLDCPLPIIPGKSPHQELPNVEEEHPGASQGQTPSAATAGHHPAPHCGQAHNGQARPAQGSLPVCARARTAALLRAVLRVRAGLEHLIVP